MSKKKILAGLLSLAMAASLAPMSVLADENTGRSLPMLGVMLLIRMNVFTMRILRVIPVRILILTRQLPQGATGTVRLPKKTETRQ